MIKIRPLLYDDLRWLMNMRNANRHAFFKTDEINWDQQMIWWALQDKDWGERHWVIANGDKPIGYFAFVAPNPELPVFPTAELKGHIKYLNSLLLEPEWRGQGLMAESIISKMNDNISYCGYVREGNTASLKTCLATGMRDMGMFDHSKYGRMHVLWRG